MFTSPRSPTIEKAEEAIENQVSHLFGPMSAAEYPAVPKADHRLTKIEISPKPGSSRTYIASYRYRGTIVVSKGAGEDYELILPVNPETIYKASIPKSGNRESPCTDSHYNSEEDFWYFWNPRNPGCPLKEGVDYLVVTGTLEKIENMKSSYPEYERLVDESGTLLMTVLVGMDESTNGRDPMQSSDLNARSFRTIRSKLIKTGFKGRRWERPDYRAKISGFPSRLRQLPYVEEFSKTGKNARVVVRMVFGPSGIDEPSTAFHYLFKDALENASAVIYNGHSGLGGHLDLLAIEESETFEINIPRDRYQIYFFDSCSSYTYYNSLYFERKKSATDPDGTRNLDILTNGLASDFESGAKNNFALIQALTDWATGKSETSYQQLATTIAGDEFFGVNGDEDNPAR
ncbi:MAG TPA: hypothetical protein VJB59_01050 [Bdellovibrionota bacterium]|nr:hypothetical protein [Bdellovibrionota bacterium]